MKSLELNLWAPSAFLMDAKTGSILYESNADCEIPPASLTKILTLYMVYKHLEKGLVGLSSCMKISDRADFRNQDKGSTVMNLKTGNRITLYDLMLGLVIASGNDAAIAVAENLEGSLENFVYKMNEQSQQWGLRKSIFKDASGLDPRNRITARELAEIVRRYIEDYPQSLDQLHNVQNFLYSELSACNVLGQGLGNEYFFENRIPLLNKYEGIDGLKTGYIDESGYNLVSTAQRGNTRLIGIMLGIKAKGRVAGDKKRAEDVKKLFDYGFKYFETVELADLVLQTVPEIRVRKGVKKVVKVTKQRDIFVTVRKDEWNFSLDHIESVNWGIKAPIIKDSLIKSFTVNITSSEGMVRKSINLIAEEDIPSSSRILRLKENFVFFLKKFKVLPTVFSLGLEA